MNTYSNILATTSAALLMSLALSGNSLAQQGQPTMPDPDMDRTSCNEIDWHEDMIRDYPWVADACHEAVIVDGQKWARFEAVFDRLNNDGTITSNFRNDRGRPMGNVNLVPDRDQRVMLDGRPTQFSELRRGQVLNFYAPEGLYAFTTEPGAPESEQVQIADRPVGRELAEEDSDRTASADERRSRELAAAERDSTARQATLPATAGPLPIIALGGLLSLLGGITLTLRRRFTTPNA